MKNDSRYCTKLINSQNIFFGAYIILWGQVSIGVRPNRITNYVIVLDFVFVVQRYWTSVEGRNVIFRNTPIPLGGRRGWAISRCARTGDDRMPRCLHLKINGVVANLFNIRLLCIVLLWILFLYTSIFRECFCECRVPICCLFSYL